MSAKKVVKTRNKYSISNQLLKFYYIHKNNQSQTIHTVYTNLTSGQSGKQKEANSELSIRELNSLFFLFNWIQNLICFVHKLQFANAKFNHNIHIQAN